MRRIEMNYFKGCNAVEQIKALYRELAFKLHPDLGGSTEAMQQLNAQYEAALQGSNGQATVGDDGQERTYRYNAGLEREIINKIDQLLRLQLQNCDLWLIGCWIWIKGDTRAYKDALKELGCRWSSKHTSWYWRREEDRTWHRSNKDLAGIAATYGASKISGSNAAISR